MNAQKDTSMPAELNRPARRALSRALSRNGPEHLQPRAPDGRIIKYRQLISAIACLLPAATLAGPKNGQVVAGESVISTPDANTTVIRQSTNKSIINWQSFSIGSQEYVKFVQPDRSSISLNRVIGGNPSSILGKLSANGQVYLVNPNGIYFGQGAQVDVSAIVASVRDIGNTDFMNGKFVFQGDASENLGNVINDGIINARNEGYVVLLGDYTENNGVIQAQMGKVVLASGSHITMDISGNNLISVAVNEATVNELAGVKNTGDIYADGGRVIMTAKVADNLIGSAVNNEGLVRASSIVEQDGAIFLTASGGDIDNSGIVDASAAAGSGVDGGAVLLYSDRDITLTAGGGLHARGDGEGAGGVIRVIAEEVLDFQSGAEISATGSPRQGGFIEVSGHGGLRLAGDMTAGSGGELLIDPLTLAIVAGGAPITDEIGTSTIATQLNAGTDVTLVADNNITAGFLTITATTNAGIAGNLNINNSNVNVNGDISLANLTVIMNGGLSVSAGTGATGNVSFGAISAAGNVAITAGGNVNLQGNVSAAGTSLAVTAGVDIAVNGGIGASTNNRLGADVILKAGNNINIDSDIFVGSNNVDLTADAGTPDGVGDVNINGRGSCSDGCFGESRTVTTRGAINIAGVDLNVNGADFGSTGTVFGNFQVPVLVSADDGVAATTTDNLTVTMTGKMTVQGGQIITGGSGDVSVEVSAGNDVNITAPGGLAVNAGIAVGTMTSGFFSSATATADATLTSGRDMTITITGGNLLVQGGNATAVASGASTSYSASGFANANATMSAARNLTVNSVGGNLTVAGGMAIATALDVNTSGCDTCTAVASANGILSAGSVIVNNVAGNINLNAGNAQAGVNGLIGDSATGGSGLATASADAVISAVTQNLSLDATSLITLAAGTALVNGSWNTNAATNSFIDSHARANATLSAANNVVVTAGTGLTLTGGNATATPNFGFGTGSATAAAQVRVTAGGLVDLDATAGTISVVQGASFSGFAFAPDVIDADATTVISAADLSAAAGVDIQLSGAINNTGPAGGAAWSLQADNNVFMGADFGASAARFDDDLIINAGNDVNIVGNIFLANRSLALAADTDSALGGDVNINASTTESRTVTTRGGLNVSGFDFNVIGANFGVRGSGSDRLVGVNVSADDGNAVTTTDNIIVNVSGQMNVQGGVANGTGSVDRDVSVRVFAGNDLSINAASLNVNGGTAIASNTSADSSTGNVVASASLAAGRSVVATLGGNLAVDAGIATAKATASGTTQGAIAFANADANFSAGSNITVNAGNISVLGGTAAATIGTSCGTCAAVASARADINATGLLSLTAGTGASVVLTTGTATTTPVAVAPPDIISADAVTSLNAGTLDLRAAVDVIGNAASINAEGIFILAGKDINLRNTTTTVGNGTAPGVSGDSLLIEIMGNAGIPLPASNNPNLKFQAGGTMTTGNLNVGASNAYLWFEADTLGVGSIFAPAGPLLVQYSPFTPTNTIGLEDLPASLEQVNYDNSNHIISYPMTTVAIGSAQQSGPITVGANGTLDIGSRNIVLLTNPDDVNSTANIITTGIVATSGFVASLREEVFVTPRLDNFHVETESWWLEAERRKQQLIESGDNNHGMCTAL